MANGRYHGDLVVKLLEDGRRVELVNPFAYTDPDDLLWKVPKKATVDGASIPRLLWTAIGGPFEGKYRNASVIHDWYCDRRSRPWEAVHRVFYHAMITSGVAAVQAKVLYAGVRWGGPRWSETVVQNARLTHPADGFGGLSNRFGTVTDFKISPMVEQRVEIKRYELPMGEASFDQLSSDVAGRDLSLADIDRLVDSRTAGLPERRLG